MTNGDDPSPRPNHTTGNLPAWISILVALMIATVPVVVVLSRIEPRLAHLGARVNMALATQARLDADGRAFYLDQWPRVWRMTADVPRLERQVTAVSVRVGALEREHPTPPGG